MCNPEGKNSQRFTTELLDKFTTSRPQGVSKRSINVRLALLIRIKAQ